MAIDGGNPPADVADQFGISLADVHRTLAYHYCHPEDFVPPNELAGNDVWLDDWAD